MTGDVKSIKIKNQTYYFFNDMVNIKDFDSDLLRIDKKPYKNMGIYYLGYIAIKKIDGYENTHSVNLLHEIVGKVDGFIEERNGNKYLISDSIDENKVILARYAELLNEVKNETETINGSKNLSMPKIL